MNWPVSQALLGTITSTAAANGVAEMTEETPSLVISANCVRDSGFFLSCARKRERIFCALTDTPEGANPWSNRWRCRPRRAATTQVSNSFGRFCESQGLGLRAWMWRTQQTKRRGSSTSQLNEVCAFDARWDSQLVVGRNKRRGADLENWQILPPRSSGKRRGEAAARGSLPELRGVPVGR